MSRLQSIDVMRVAAIVAVIVIHASPFATQPELIGNRLDAATVANQLARFAVPFFITVSGYLWAHKIESERDVHAPTIKMARRILVLLLAWSAIYLLPTNIAVAFEAGTLGPLKHVYWNVMRVVDRPFDTALGGTKQHLWFLPGLLCGLVISALLIRCRQQWLLVGLAIALYLVGLAGKAYSDTPLGFSSEFNFRNGPFFALAFFATGYLLHLRRATPSWLPTGIVIAVCGIILHFTELVVLNAYWGTTMSQDYVVGTYFYGVGMAMIALSGTRYLHLERAATIGPLVLGIYASHMIFLDLLDPLDERLAGGVVWSLIHVAAIFMLSYALVRVMARCHHASFRHVSEQHVVAHRSKLFHWYWLMTTHAASTVSRKIIRHGIGTDIDRRVGGKARGRRGQPYADDGPEGSTLRASASNSPGVPNSRSGPVRRSASIGA